MCIGDVLQAAAGDGVQAQADAGEAGGRGGAADAGGDGAAEAGVGEVRKRRIRVWSRAGRTEGRCG